MQFSLRYDEEMWELTDHEKEVMILAIYWEITPEFHMVPIDYNGFRSFVYSKSRLLTREVKASISDSQVYRFAATKGATIALLNTFILSRIVKLSTGLSITWNYTEIIYGLISTELFTQEIDLEFTIFIRKYIGCMLPTDRRHFWNQGQKTNTTNRKIHV